jgi:uncharacterized protein (DUF1697 family)
MNEKQNHSKTLYVAFLRGINVGGKHKVPMKTLRSTLEEQGYSRVKTLLNSGNAIFEADSKEEQAVEDELGPILEEQFGFPIPVLIRKMSTLQDAVAEDPFADIAKHQELQLYVTFVRSNPQDKSGWRSPDGSFQVVGVKDRMIFSSLDLSKSRTVDAMKLLEKKYSKDITTRNWNTIVKLVQAI